MKAIRGGKKNRIITLKEDYVDLSGLDRDDFIKHKPKADFNLLVVSFMLKPWKGKVGSISMIWDDSEPIEEFIKKRIFELQKGGQYKRRTVKTVVVEYRVNKKL